MIAMLLAAGRGKRMRPLTDTVPKPLLTVAGVSLIEHQLRALQSAGIVDVVINLGWLGEQIRQRLGDGSSYGVSITYSQEPEDAYDTGGGIVNALPLLGGDPFLVVNSDIWTDYDYRKLDGRPDSLGHIVLVDNPAHNPDGDFMLEGELVRPAGRQCLTFSGIGVYRAALFEGHGAGRYPLAPILRDAMKKDAITGEHFTGTWSDIGTPERLQALDLVQQLAGAQQ